ncbi:putative dicarboxylic amino acid permease [Coleophoma crateriformis]|uniref:Putative dicarboxylic amino acid permease n=1 Tax=Coleophoma crateriformis TaxID=565419 RepID=A0A3D8RVG9_9HELO|nr:putative dicarboxylic amino acid permease [Coleophoma crateriformis]
MADIHKYGDDSSSQEKGPHAAFQGPAIVDHGDVDSERDLTHRGLGARQVTMIAIGGAIGTGLIIGTGKALAQAGPASLLIGYTLVGFECFLVMAALGEMAAWLPLPSGFTGYANRFVDPALGYCLGVNYWFKYIIVTPNNLVACSLVLQFWASPDKINPGVWIAIFLVLIIAINFLGVRFFGEFEFYLSSIKVIVIIALILLSLILACGGGPNHTPTGFVFYKNPGAFHEYILTGSAGRFLAVWSTFTTAVFAYLGTELVGVTVGEAANPRRVIPRAIKLTFYRILLFYVVLVFLLTLLVPYNSPQLIAANKKSTTATASPFVVAITLSGIKTLPAILNGCILVFVLSAANSDLYIASRTLYGLAKEGKAPAIFKRCDSRGVPIYALGLSSCFCLLAFLSVSKGSNKVFGYFVNLVTMFGLLTWISILISHIFFVKARRAQGIPNDALAYVAPLGIWGSYGALAFAILIAIFKGFPLFCYKKLGTTFDTSTFITTYLGIPLYFIMFFGYKFTRKTKVLKPHEADLYSGKARIDAEEEEFLARQSAKKGGPETTMEKIYRLTLGWAF